MRGGTLSGSTWTPPLWLTRGVCGPQGAGSGLLVALAVAGGQRLGHRRGGALGGLGGPAQGELQRGTLREALKGRQTLETNTTPTVHWFHWFHCCLQPPSGVSPTFPSRMVSHVALFLLTGHSSVSCMDTSYSPSKSCSRLQRAHTETLHQPRRRLAACFCLSVTCFYQRRSSEPQTWPLRPPAERSSSASCSQLPLESLNHTRRQMTPRRDELVPPWS